MINFMMKHPFWAYCMLDCICVTIENVAKGCARKTKAFDRVTDYIAEEATMIKNDLEKNKKEPMGFHPRNIEA